MPCQDRRPHNPTSGRGRLLLLALLASCLQVDSAAQSAVATTDPVGFTRTSLPAGADTRISVPLTRPPVFRGLIELVSGNTLTVAGPPGWTTNQWVNAAGAQRDTFYVLIGKHRTAANPREGRDYVVTANGTNTLALDLNGDNLDGVVPGTEISLIPFWTLNSLFPAEQAGVSFTASPSAFARKTEIYLPPYEAVGINAAAADGFFFLNGAWRKIGRPVTEDHGDTILLPSGLLTIRQNGDAATGEVVPLGSVAMTKIAVPLATQSSGKQDNPVSLLRPVPVSLDDSGLVGSGAFSASASSFNRGDELFVFDNSLPGYNKAAAATYYYFNGAWRKVGAPVTDNFGPDLLGIGSGFVIRKAPSVDGATQFWLHDRTYGETTQAPASPQN